MRQERERERERAREREREREMKRLRHLLYIILKVLNNLAFSVYFSSHSTQRAC